MNRNKYLLFAVPCLIVIFSIYQFRPVDKIVWKADNQLVWDDFRGILDTTSRYQANTWYNINYRYQWDASNNITYSIECTFNKNKSYKKLGASLYPGLLRHEQLHFDVAELHARKMRGAFAKYAALHKYTTNTPNDLKIIFDKLMDECKAYNDRYDVETNHSMIEEEQKLWDKKIVHELDSLDDYRQR